VESGFIKGIYYGRVEKGDKQEQVCQGLIRPKDKQVEIEPWGKRIILVEPESFS
jgi:hypothetical protein